MVETPLDMLLEIGFKSALSPSAKGAAEVVFEDETTEAREEHEHY